MAVNESSTSFVRLLAAANFSELCPPQLPQSPVAEQDHMKTIASFSCITPGQPQHLQADLLDVVQHIDISHIPGIGRLHGIQENVHAKVIPTL